MSGMSAPWLSDVCFSSYTPGDEQRIVEFFRECGYRHTQRFWQWINQEYPDGQTIFRYAELNGKIIAHYSVLPRRVCIGGKEILAGLGIHMASHPDYRSTWVLVNLVKQVLKVCKAAGMLFIYGFPNENSWLISQRLLGWKAVTDIPALEVSLSNLASILNVTSQTDPTPLQFRDEHSALLESCLLPGLIAPHKSAAYLNWRYTNHPRVNYCLLEEHRKGKLVGFLVLKLYKKEGTLYGHILEWGVTRKDTDLLGVLLASAVRFFLKNRVAIVSCWMTSEHPFYSMLTELGFYPKGFITHFGYRSISEVDSSNRSWFITMGDSDAF